MLNCVSTVLCPPLCSQISRGGRHLSFALTPPHSRNDWKYLMELRCQHQESTFLISCLDQCLHGSVVFTSSDQVKISSVVVLMSQSNHLCSVLMLLLSSFFIMISPSMKLKNKILFFSWCINCDSTLSKPSEKPDQHGKRHNIIFLFTELVQQSELIQPVGVRFCHFLLRQQFVCVCESTSTLNGDKTISMQSLNSFSFFLINSCLLEMCMFGVKLFDCCVLLNG